MLLESFYKIIANIIHARLLPIAEALDNETQCGFRPGRSCSDAIFAVKMAMRKRKEHNQETYILFLDLVKAFDRVPRELLWQVLKKSGVPDKLISLITKLHSNVSVNFRIAEISRSFNNTIGVKQGDTLGPLLFIFFITAILHTWRKTSSVAPCIFKSTPLLYKLSGRRVSTQGDIFLFRDSAYADDTAAAFKSRANIEVGGKELIEHFAKFGMEVHTGYTLDQTKKSKSKILHVPLPQRNNLAPIENDTTPIDCGNSRNIPITNSFNYLGSVTSAEATDSADVLERISAANKAFGALREPVFSSRKIARIAKVALYRFLIIPILLYGAECWVLTSRDESLLRTFHNNCARAIIRIYRKRQFRNYISTQTILNKLRLPRIESLYARHVLRWAGHLARMKYNRLPRRFINSWTSNNRPTGSPNLTYARHLFKIMRRHNINPRNWHTMAANREQWSKIIKDIH